MSFQIISPANPPSKSAVRIQVSKVEPKGIYESINVSFILPCKVVRAQTTTTTTATNKETKRKQKIKKDIQSTSGSRSAV